MKLLNCAVILMLLSTPLMGAELSVTFELPAFEVEDYKKPYVAIWAEAKDKRETLLLWHLHKRGKEDHWLPDIRRWWRKAGRYGMPEADGITGATRSAGEYKVDLDIGKIKQFELLIEVAREDGGRTLLRQKINISEGRKDYRLAGKDEVKNVVIKVQS